MNADRKSGIYALIRFDGAPIEAADAAALGLSLDAPIAAADLHAPHALACDDSGGETTVFAGEIADRVELAARLGLSSDASLAQLARVALARFGSETPAELVGEWSLLHRDAAGTVTLILSAARRDPLLYALSGPRLAVAPDLFALGRIAWIGDELDEAGLLFAWGRAKLHSAAGERTMLARVRKVLPGSSVTIRPDGTMQTHRAEVFPAPKTFTGSYTDALAEVEALLGRIMRERFARGALIAPTLSGGLDSSLLAWLAVTERGNAPPPLFVTSVAPPGSGLPDESRFAAMVAEHLGNAIHPAFPEPALDMYRPHDAILAGANAPPLSTRHCLTEGFQRTARAAGAALLINGSYGEMTVTARLQPPTPLRRLRGALGRLRPRNHAAIPLGDFQVRLAPHRLAALPEPVREALASPAPGPKGHPTLLGYQPGAEKPLLHANEFYAGALRMDFPYRDLRLLRFCAGLPLATLRAGGADRGLARAMLAGRLPDVIRLRTSGMPAVPDHYQRLQRQAEGARGRIAAFRAAGVDDWLDLDWLDAALGRIAAHGARGVAEANEVQITAIGAEFLTWLRTRA